MLNRKIVGVGCACHIIHNAYDAACEQLPINIESLVVVFYKHFHIHTLRVESLKTICDDQEVTYTKLVSHSGTRFLTLHPAVKKVRRKNIFKAETDHWFLFTRSFRCLVHLKPILTA